MPDEKTYKFGEKNRFKVGSFTRDQAVATGTQAITGIGFPPRVAYFFACQDGAVGEMSLGFSDGALARCVLDRHTFDADAWGISGSLIATYQSGADGYDGLLQTGNGSFDSDGFTISWFRTGNPTGTITVIYLAMG